MSILSLHAQFTDIRLLKYKAKSSFLSRRSQSLCMKHYSHISINILEITWISTHSHADASSSSLVFLWMLKEMIFRSFLISLGTCFREGTLHLLFWKQKKLSEACEQVLIFPVLAWQCSVMTFLLFAAVSIELNLHRENQASSSNLWESSFN